MKRDTHELKQTVSQKYGKETFRICCPKVVHLSEHTSSVPHDSERQILLQKARTPWPSLDRAWHRIRHSYDMLLVGWESIPCVHSWARQHSAVGNHSAPHDSELRALKLQTLLSWNWFDNDWNPQMPYGNLGPNNSHASIIQWRSTQDVQSVIDNWRTWTLEWRKAGILDSWSSRFIVTQEWRRGFVWHLVVLWIWADQGYVGRDPDWLLFSCVVEIR